MNEHQFIQDDPMIQKCTYDNGMFVTINLHDNTYSFGCVSNDSNLWYSVRVGGNYKC